MLRTIEAVINPQGHIQWSEDVDLHVPQRVLITLLDSNTVDETLLAAESSLAKDWLNSEEDAAWAHLQPGA
jgi:hypothetical protein